MPRNYHKLAAAGLCVRCGHPQMPGHCLCKLCHVSQTAWRLQVRQERLDQGLCIVCGMPKGNDKYMSCDFCRKKHRKSEADNRRYYQAKKARMAAKNKED